MHAVRAPAKNIRLALVACGATAGGRLQSAFVIDPAPPTVALAPPGIFCLYLAVPLWCASTDADLRGIYQALEYQYRVRTYGRDFREPSFSLGAAVRDAPPALCAAYTSEFHRACEDDGVMVGLPEVAEGPYPPHLVMSNMVILRVRCLHHGVLRTFLNLFMRRGNGSASSASPSTLTIWRNRVKHTPEVRVVRPPPHYYDASGNTLESLVFEKHVPEQTLLFPLFLQCNTTLGRHVPQLAVVDGVLPSPGTPAVVLENQVVYTLRDTCNWQAQFGVGIATPRVGEKRTLEQVTTSDTNNDDTQPEATPQPLTKRQRHEATVARGAYKAFDKAVTDGKSVAYVQMCYRDDMFLAWARENRGSVAEKALKKASPKVRAYLQQQLPSVAAFADAAKMMDATDDAPAIVQLQIARHLK